MGFFPRLSLIFGSAASLPGDIYPRYSARPVGTADDTKS